MDKTESNSQIHIECHAKNRASSSRQNNSESVDGNQSLSQQRMFKKISGNGHGINNTCTNLTRSTTNLTCAQNTQKFDAVGRTHASNSQAPSAGQKLIMAAETGDLSALDRLLQQQQGGSEHFISQDQLNVSLLEACRQGRKFIVQKLVRSGAEVNVGGNKRCTTPLHIAAEQGFVDIAAFLLDKDADVDACDGHGNSALILAVNRAGSSDMLNLLLAYKAKINHKNSQRVTALMKAAEVMDIDAVKILILAGSNLKQKNRVGETARDISARLGIADVFDFLQSEKEDQLHLHVYSADSRCAVSKAALNHHAQAVKILLDCRYLQPKTKCKDLHESKEANQNIKIDTLRKLIELICSDAKDNKDLDGAKLELVKILLGSGIDCKTFKQQYRFHSKISSLLVNASQSGVIELVELLCKLKNIDINSTDRISALMGAAEIGRLDIVKLLLNFGADPRKDYRGKLALTYALKNGHIECANVLLHNHKPSEQKLQGMAKVAVQEKQLESLEFLASHCNIDEISQSLMEEGILTCDSRIVQFLIDHGADINGTCGRSCPALLIALKIGRSYYNSPLIRKDCNQLDMIKFLVESGASVKRVNTNKSPLVFAIENNCNLDVLLSLLEHGADVNEIGDNKGNTPLTAVFAWHSTRQPTFLEALLKAGADLNKANSDGKTALHLAVYIGKDDVGSIKQLISAGADLEARDSDGMTPLLLAAREQQLEVIKLLKECGANMKAVDNYGKNAVFQTFERGYGDDETLQLVASDKDQVNMQMPDGVTPLIVAAKKHDNKAIEIFLKAGADPHKKNDNQETALSNFLGSCIPTHKAMVGLKMLIRHGALLSLPKYDCLNLYRMIVTDERELVQLMVTHGMAPMCVDFTGVKNSLSMEGISDSVWRNLSPLAAALVGNRLVIARYLVANWFLTPVDLVGSDQLKNLKVGLQGKCTSEVENFLDEYMSQPMSLMQLSFVAVSAQLGETIGREERVRKTPLPTILQDRLLFKKEMSSMESTDEEENCMNRNFLVYEQLAALTLISQMNNRSLFGSYYGSDYRFYDDDYDYDYDYDDDDD
ncbi:hypothetical protein RRG08_050394 [Elysia crispata]|uniref:Uncharacterized protein n=1 Tax=Elysia crispata TaxID=231223 RepID=A0AAE0YWF4_9GAST|nr:hypothetical protein RRG08_050394 [Elysia crispata]